jgi:hypothetical protein
MRLPKKCTGRSEFRHNERSMWRTRQDKREPQRYLSSQKGSARVRRDAREENRFSND